MNKGVLAAIIIATLAALAAGGVALSSNSSDDDTQEQKSTDTEKSNKTSEYSLSLGDYYYTPNKITAEPGEKLVLRLNIDEGMHDFVIDELNVKTEIIEEGDQSTVEFTIPADAVAGKVYDFYCSVGNHRALGMTGTITVK